MRCPSCNGRTGVIDSRGHNNGDTQHRRRECLSCGKRYSTAERYVQQYRQRTYRRKLPAQKIC